MTSDHLSAETLFDLLQNRRRRYLLYALDQRADSTVTLDELTERVRDWEQRLNPEDGTPTADSELQVRVSLHHNHLPRLAELGLIEYDPQCGIARKGDAAPVADFLETHRDEVPHLRSLFSTSTTS